MASEEGDFLPGQWQELEAGPRVQDEMPTVRPPYRRGVWRRLFTTPITQQMRDVGLLVIAVWLCAGTALFFAMQLAGFAYQELFSLAISAYTQRFIGCWFFTLLLLGVSVVRMLAIWIRYRCCRR